MNIPKPIIIMPTNIPVGQESAFDFDNHVMVYRSTTLIGLFLKAVP